MKPSLTGRKLFIILFITGIVLLVGSFLVLGYENTWRLWNIPVKLPVFYDLRLITAGAESYSHGYDPAYNNPYDPEQRLFNYPRIWYLILASGIDQNATIILGIALVSAFLTSIALVFKKIDKSTAIILMAVIFSPAILLGVERGNVDLLIFVLLAFALFSVNYSKPLSLVLMLIATLLKIYPILGVGYLLDDDRRSSKYSLLGIAMSALYLIISMKDLQHIFVSTQKGTDVSYGVSVLAAKLSPYIGNGSGTLNTLLYVIAGVLILGVSFLALRNRSNSTVDNTYNMSLFRLSAGIFIGTFLLGNNWDYRLMFLIFAIPQLVTWARSKSGFSSIAAKICLAAVLVSCWYLEFWRIADLAGTSGRIASFMLDELANWTLFAGLVYLYIASLPRWMLDFIPARLYQRLAHHQ